MYLLGASLGWGMIGTLCLICLCGFFLAMRININVINTRDIRYEVTIQGQKAGNLSDKNSLWTSLFCLD